MPKTRVRLPHRIRDASDKGLERSATNRVDPVRLWAGDHALRSGIRLVSKTDQRGSIPRRRAASGAGHEAVSYAVLFEFDSRRCDAWVATALLCRLHLTRHGAEDPSSGNNWIPGRAPFSESSSPGGETILTSWPCRVRSSGSLPPCHSTMVVQSPDERPIRVRSLVAGLFRSVVQQQNGCPISAWMVVRVHPDRLWPSSSSRIPDCVSGDEGANPSGHPTIG